MKKLILSSLFALNLGLWSDLVSNKAWALEMVTGTVMPAITVDSLTVTNAAAVGGALTAVGPFTVSPGSMTVRVGANQVFGVYSVGGILRTGSLNDIQNANAPWYVDGNPLALNTGGGSVGIGTASPGTKLHMSSGTLTVDGTDANMTISPSGTGSPYIFLKRAGTATAIIGAAGAAGDLATGSTAGDAVVRVYSNDFIISTDGGASIAASVNAGGSPTTLDVNGSAQFGSGATKSTFTTTGALVMGAAIQGGVAASNTPGSGISYWDYPSSNYWGIGAKTDTSFKLDTYNSAGAYQTSLTVNRDGQMNVNGSTLTVASSGIVSAPSQPGFSASTATVSIPNNSFTSLVFQSESFDRQGVHSAGLFTVPANGGGLYLITCRAVMDAAATGTRAVRLVDGDVTTEYDRETESADSATDNFIRLQIVQELAASDSRRCQVFQTSGGALNLSAGRMEAVKLW